MNERQVEEVKRLVVSRQPKVELFSEDNHWYRLNGVRKWVPSVTTMIGNVISKGYGFHRWLGNHPSYAIACEERDIAAALGTKVHKYCETLLTKQTIDISKDTDGDKVWKRLLSFEKWVNTVTPDILAVEYKLVHPDILWSGTPDFVCIIDGSMCMVDIKTGSPYDTHELQLTCYKMLWDAVIPEYPIDKILGLYLKDSWKTKVEPLCKEYNFIPKVADATRSIWEWQNGSNAQPNMKPSVKTTFSIKETVNDERRTPELIL